MPQNDIEHRSEFIRDALTRHEAALLRHAQLITGDLETAQDAVQDTFVRLWDAPMEEIRDHLAQWLFTVCRNRAIDLRRKERRMTPLVEEHLEARESGDPSPALQAEQRDSLRTVLQWLDLLPPNQREVVRLKFQAQLSYEEIAAVTSLSVSNVGVLLHTAIRTLRHKMARLETPTPSL